MGYRNVIKNKLNHKHHLFVVNNPKLSQPENTPIFWTCWCGEIVEEVIS